ncbi:ribulose-phosphate 3-epimerase [Candidatus Poribacteria bacterium]|nr:ribulose-phosphate 3-epimerase [Candidatus Poribacteria bacterium]
MRKVVPSVLTRDPKELEEKVRILEPLVEVIQIDIMDNVLVPNTSINVKDVEKAAPQKPMEIHLMVNHPVEYVEPYACIGAFRIIFHIESADDPAEVIKEIKSFNMKAGIAINPPTPVEKLDPYLDMVDLVLVMGVNPGFQGQKFIPDVLDKVRYIKKSHPDMTVEVDGGVNPETGPSLVEAGVDILNVGSYLFKQMPVEDNWETMQKIARGE